MWVIQQLHCMHVPSVWHLKGLTILVYAHLCITWHILSFLYFYHISNILTKVSDDSPNIRSQIYLQYIQSLCILSIWCFKNILDFWILLLANPSHLAFRLVEQKWRQTGQQTRQLVGRPGGYVTDGRWIPWAGRAAPRKRQWMLLRREVKINYYG